MEFDIYKELKQLAEHLQNPDRLFKDDKTAEIALHTGLSGIMLTLADIRKGFPELVKPEILADYTGKAYEILVSSEAFYPSFSGGLAGYAYLLQWLITEGYSDPDEYREVITEIDEILAEHFESNLEKNHIDMLHGAMGMAFYFMEKGNDDYAGKLIDKLTQTAKTEENRSYWNTFDYYKTRKYKIDYGLAHGNAGIQYFLGKCLHHGIKTDTCKQLLEESLNFYRASLQDINRAKSYFPTFIMEESYRDKTAKPEMSRVAWCYGDLGILYTHLLVADVLEDEVLKAETIARLKQVARRRTVAETLYKDAGFCHGTSGIALIFKNAYNRTGEPVFREAADYWLQKTYDFKTTDENGEAYCLFEGQLRNDTDSTLLEGLSGVAAAYLAAVSPVGTSLIDKAVFLRF